MSQSRPSRSRLRPLRLVESLGSFKVLASVSEAATSCLGLGQNFECLGLVSETRVSCLTSVSAQKVSCTSLSVCIKVQDATQFSNFSSINSSSNNYSTADN